jgi:hypothetical protein
MAGPEPLLLGLTTRLLPGKINAMIQKQHHYRGGCGGARTFLPCSSGASLSSSSSSLSLSSQQSGTRRLIKAL